MIAEGLTLTVVGMGVVFLFLLLLVYAMRIQSYVVTRFFPAKEEPAKVAAGNGKAMEAEIAAAVAAVRKHSRQ